MSATQICSQVARRYLLWCANVHVEFRIPELMSIASMFKIPIKWIDKPVEDPYVIVEMRNESDAKKLMSRSLLVRSCYELWGEGSTEAEMHTSVQSFPRELIAPHLAPSKTFKVCVTTFNKTLRNAEKLAKIEALKYLPFEGRVDLKNADTRLHLIEYYGLHPNHIPSTPYKVFLGRWVAEGQRDLISRYSLKQRSYIGSTSMDAELAFIMNNLAQVQPGEVVVDPFVGTGSVLVSAAHWGANVWGWDIDYLTLHARTKPTRHSQKKRTSGESICSNFEQYGLKQRYLDVAVMDNARLFWRTAPFVDAIITDPPYGIREATERVGSVKKPKHCDSTCDGDQPSSACPQQSTPSSEISTTNLEITTMNPDKSTPSTQIPIEPQLLTEIPQISTPRPAVPATDPYVPTTDPQSPTSSSQISTPSPELPTSTHQPPPINSLPSLSSQISTSDSQVHTSSSQIPTSTSQIPTSSSQIPTSSPHIPQVPTPVLLLPTSTPQTPPTNNIQPPSSIHFPSKVTYSLSDIFRDLLNFAASHLVIGGRLVFWLPVFREDYDESHVPSHPCLELLFNCEQVLTVHSSRRLITLCKTRHPQAGETASGQVTDVTAQFRERFFQASLITKEERASLKSQFPRDKRGQGLGYRLEEARNKLGNSEVQNAFVSESGSGKVNSGVLENASKSCDSGSGKVKLAVVENASKSCDSDTTW